MRPVPHSCGVHEFPWLTEKIRVLVAIKKKELLLKNGGAIIKFIFQLVGLP